MKEEIRRIQLEDLPFFHRLVLKLPSPNLNFLPDVSKGVFWAFIVPIFIASQSFLTLYLLIAFRFPLNLLLVGAIPSFICLMAFRMSLERFLILRNTVVAQTGYKWDLKKSAQEYYMLLEKKKRQKTRYS